MYGHSARTTSRRHPTRSRPSLSSQVVRPYPAALLALRRPGRPCEANPDPDIVIEEGSVLIALGNADEANSLRRRVDAP